MYVFIFAVASALALNAYRVTRPAKLEPDRFRTELSSEISAGSFLISCREAIKKQLKTPATAKFPDLNTTVIRQDGFIYDAIINVDAQNDFGALLRSKWTCIVNGETQRVTVSIYP